MRPFALLLVLSLAGVVCSGDVPPPRGTVTSLEGRPMVAEDVGSLQGPGPEHGVLRALSGEWDTELKIFPVTGGEPATLRATTHAKMILGGRYLEIATDLGPDGSLGGTLQILGFDRRHARFTIAGFDTFGTYSVAAAGRRDPATGAISLRGVDDDPVLGLRRTFELLIERDGNDRWTLSTIFHDTSHGHDEPYKMIEAAHTRRD